jgi:tetratricopeptide (TPR) repeat protein
VGNLSAAANLFERAQANGRGCFSAALANYPLTLYLSGRLTEAEERARQAAEIFRGANDAFAANFGHPHLGLALAARGRYAEAAAVFQEASQLGMRHKIWHFRARAIAMSAGFHLDVFDFEGNERLAREAREEARSAPFRPSEVSATIDLAFNSIRRGRVSQAEELMKEAEALIAQVAGWHEWLWRLRMKQARAELACAREEWESALALASDALCESRARDRLKYVAFGLETRARALAALRRRSEAVADLRAAAELARSMGDPALSIRVAVPLLQIDGDDALLSEARATARQILTALPDDEMRRRFESSQTVQRLGRI